mmetsp:Transcript_21855/g.57909  ORF Transcript_21855/g.57909 Transcript_21855/m.57909 type:complete len:221 (-) Transcript_21855:368-1030(-)
MYLSVLLDTTQDISTLTTASTAAAVDEVVLEVGLEVGLEVSTSKSVMSTSTLETVKPIAVESSPESSFATNRSAKTKRSLVTFKSAVVVSVAVVDTLPLSESPVKASPGKGSGSSSTICTTTEEPDKRLDMASNARPATCAELCTATTLIRDAAIPNSSARLFTSSGPSKSSVFTESVIVSCTTSRRRRKTSPPPSLARLSPNDPPLITKKTVRTLGSNA